jgi:hypothetical protein
LDQQSSERARGQDETYLPLAPTLARQLQGDEWPKTSHDYGEEKVEPIQTTQALV